MQASWSFLAVVHGVLGLLAACSEHESPNPEPIGGTGGYGGTGGVAGEGSGAVAGNGGSGGNVCIAEFPCFERTAFCDGTTRVSTARTVSCTEFCGSQPCTGGICRPVGPSFDCPEGTVCRDVPHFQGGTAACVDPGGFGGTGGGGSGPFAGDCGNARIDNVEACDDGNQTSGDGCSQYCTGESDWRCTEPGQPCTPLQGEAACAQDACRHGALCLDPATGVACACPDAALPACPAPALIGLPLIDDAAGCAARAVSADGSTVVGFCSLVEGTRPNQRSRSQATRWTLTGGVELYPGDGDSDAFSVSQDGSVVVGRDALGAFIWRANDVVHLEGAGAAVSVSADGRVVIGDGPAYVWTADAGVQPLPPLTAGLTSHAVAISADGRRIVGSEGNDIDGTPLEWTVDGRARALPALSNTVSLIPSALSADGSIIVGNAWTALDGASTAVRWTASGVETIAPNDSFAGLISADGLTIFGSVGPESVVWDPGLARQPLAVMLAAAGVNADGWSLAPAGVSSNGRVLVGQGQRLVEGDGRLRAFMIVMP
ncbi:MAG TPA: hypothetical protein VMG12_12700 [Polyangiaceae bacterium]|nr:hypothetical protein [Polyangiaceae bacterium]